MSGPILTLERTEDSADLALYLRHLIKLDHSVVVRFQQHGDRVLVWADPGFRTLAVRGLSGSVEGRDVVVGADGALAGLVHAQDEGKLTIDLGFRMDSAWRGGRPPVDGYEHIEEIDTRDIVRLADQGQVTAEENPGPMGMSASLLNHDVIVVNSSQGDLGIQLRSLFTLVSCGFIRIDSKRQPLDADDKVLVRVSGDWLRLDARYGSVAQKVTRKHA